MLKEIHKSTAFENRCWPSFFAEVNSGRCFLGSLQRNPLVITFVCLISISAVAQGKSGTVVKTDVKTPAGQILPHKVEPKSGLEFIRIPAGMIPSLGDVGAPPTSSGKDAINSLWFGKTDVTVAAYKACAFAGACSPAAETRDEGPQRCNWKNQRMDHPMNCVSWAESGQFCKWIGGRLPSTAEWEYAATSGRPGQKYPWGDSPVDGKHADYCDVNCAKALGTVPSDGKNLDRWNKVGWIDRSQDDGWATTAPVGTYPQGATAWGLLDMAGNVWQWTSTESGDGKREVRGGSWDNAPASLVTSRRLPWPEGATDSGMGFRCVLPNGS